MGRMRLLRVLSRGIVGGRRRPLVGMHLIFEGEKRLDSDDAYLDLLRRQRDESRDLGHKLWTE